MSCEQFPGYTHMTAGEIKRGCELYFDAKAEQQRAWYDMARTMVTQYLSTKSRWWSLWNGIPSNAVVTDEFIDRHVLNQYWDETQLAVPGLDRSTFPQTLVSMWTWRRGVANQPDDKDIIINIEDAALITEWLNKEDKA